MIRVKSTDRITISGLSGSGKTTLARYLASFAEPDLIIIDALGQYFGDFPEQCIRYPKQMDPMFLEGIAKELWGQKNKVLLIEEAEQFMRQGKPLPEYTSGLVRMGRNWGIGIIAVTRRIQELSKEFFGHCQQVFFFKCDLKSREYIAELIGREFVYPQVRCINNHTGKTINTLPWYCWLHYNLETEETEVAKLNIKTVRTHVETLEGKKSEAGKETVKEIAKSEIKEPAPAPAPKPTLLSGESKPKEELGGKPEPWKPSRKE